MILLFVASLTPASVVWIRGTLKPLLLVFIREMIVGSLSWVLLIHSTAWMMVQYVSLSCFLSRKIADIWYSDRIILDLVLFVDCERPRSVNLIHS